MIRVRRCHNRHVVLPTPAKDAVLSILRDLAPELAMLGVTRMALFGSVARGEDTPDSDVDIAVSVVDPPDIMVFAYARNFIEMFLGRRADLVDLPLRWPLTETAAEDLIPV